MVYVSLIVPENVPRNFLDLAFEEGLVDIVHPTDPHALFDRSQSCACDTRDKLAIRDRTVIVKKNHHQALGMPFYALPEDCTFEETYVIVAWLIRHKFKSFISKIDKETNVFRRTIETNCWFVEKIHSNDCCTCFILVNDPVFLLRKIVLSPFGKGPVLESCLIKK